MNLWQNFVRPATVSEALIALRDAPAPAIPIAGGTDLLLDLDEGRHTPTSTLIDLTSVAEMSRLELRDNSLFVGAAVPLTEVVRHPLVARHAQALVEACDLIGGPQVRNVATLGGNVAHALPAADGTIALLALDATVEIASLSGSRRQPLADIFLAPGRTTLKAGHELLLGFHLPLAAAREGSAFQRIMRPQGVALPILNLAVWIRRIGEQIGATRIALGPSGPTPRRALEAEQTLVGNSLSQDTCQAAVDALLSHAALRSSPRRATAEYRRHLADGLAIQTLECAWKRTWE
jgi:xanthine dehydrogenase FAD-binding subunit